MIEQVKKAFNAQFPDSKKPIIVSAPGRVNLIGEHTDYNDGYVLPMAIDSKIVLMGSLRDDKEVHLYSLDFQAGDQFDLSQIQPTNKETWSNYIRGICAMFLKEHELQGMNIVLHGNVPQGAGLSSSAALEVGTALLIRNLHQLDTDPVEIVKLAQRAENEFVGVQCGIMDQFISMLGKEGHVLFLDCRSLDYERVPVPFESAKFVVVESGVKRGLVDSEYNIRRSQCNEAVEQLGKQVPGIKALRDLAVEHLPLINDLPEDLAKRARHVVTENQRVLDAITALKNNDIDRFGKLMNESHTSLRDDYEVSCKELDLLVELAQSSNGTFGARMTGAGFGGCIVALVNEDNIPALKELILKEYPRQTGLTPRIFIFSASDGAHQIS